MQKFTLQFADNTELSSKEIVDYLTDASHDKYGLDCITVTETIGTWKGTQERSFKIEVIELKDRPYIECSIVAFGMHLKYYFSQEAVLFTKEEIEAELI